LWAVAVYDLHLTSEQFYALTLRQFSALQNRFVESERRKDRRTARIVSHIVNMAGRSVKNFMTEDQFMPGEQAAPKKQTTAEMISILRMHRDAMHAKGPQNG